jgi:hypothetical protein
VSAVVQALPSSQGALLLLYTQPCKVSQLSSVQTSPSSQTGGAPPVQLPPLQVSPVVHASPSLHGAALFVNTHPCWESQLSSVHVFPSLHVSTDPPWHIPAEHVSEVVQASPSSHGAVLFE